MIVIYKGGEFKRYTEIPKEWEKEINGSIVTVYNYHKELESIHYSDGWREPIYPSINTMTQKLGDLKWVDVVGGEVTFHIIDLPDEEIKQRVLSNAQIQKEQFTRVKLEKQVETELQAITDDAEILENQAGYPLWQDLPDGYLLTVDMKVQDFEGLELKTYKTISQHQKQDNWFPQNVPALFVKVLPPGAALIWEAGIAVTVGQQYDYQGTMYEVVQSHTTQLGWEPPNVPSLWTEVV